MTLFTKHMHFVLHTAILTKYVKELQRRLFQRSGFFKEAVREFDEGAKSKTVCNI